MFGDDVAPAGRVLGPGDPDVAVVGSVHGDEPTGARAIHRVVDSAYSPAAGVVSVEAGEPERHRADEKAVALVWAVLSITDAVDDAGGVAGSGDGDDAVVADDAPATRSDPDYYEIHDAVEKPPEDDSWELLVSNFECVEAGTTYARRDDETLVADEPFVPVLMSEAGYPEIFGYRGRKVAESADGAREAWLDGDG